MQGVVAAEFQQYVMPVEQPRLSAFCTQLTGIRCCNPRVSVGGRTIDPPPLRPLMVYCTLALFRKSHFSQM